ncbi:MAG: hypothetical protein KJ042_08610 [Deltaproteobacteria bacterium]|nr:hypothetical protein [Deltaproteobacteria bacterium]
MRMTVVLMIFAALGLSLSASCSSPVDEPEIPGADDSSQKPESGPPVIWGGTWDGTAGIWQANSGTGKVEAILEAPVQTLWTIPGEQAFVIAQTDGSVVYRPRSGDAIVTEATVSAFPAPIGRRLLYVRDGVLFETAVGGVGSRPIALGAKWAAYRPQLDQILYVKADGVYLEPIVATAPAVPVIVPPGAIDTSTEDPAMTPAFSPDGKFAAVPLRVQAATGVQIMMYLIDVEARAEITWIAKGTSPNWSHAGGKVAYVSDARLYTWEVGTGANTQAVLDTVDASARPRWSSDDAALLYTVRKGGHDTLRAAPVGGDQFVSIVSDNDGLIAGFDWTHDPLCPTSNAAPDVTSAQAVIDGVVATTSPVVVPDGASVAVRLVVGDAECNVRRGLVFGETGGMKSTIAWELPDGACEAGADIPLSLDATAGDATWTFSVEDACGAQGAGAEIAFTFAPGDDDTDDDTTDDDTADDDTTDDDTSDDDTADDDTV